MIEITLTELQKAITKIDHKNNAIDKYFYKLTEELENLPKKLEKQKKIWL